MKTCTLTATMMAAATALSGCSTTGRVAAAMAATAQPETISYSVGPCFGYCPVYSVALSPSGTVSYEGTRHTAALGVRTREAGPDAYLTVARSLAPFRPASGMTAETKCEVKASDLSTYRITWTTPGGRRTVLEHGLGCRSAENDRLAEALRQVPATLGIAEWSSQVTRAGATRG